MYSSIETDNTIYASTVAEKTVYDSIRTEIQHAVFFSLLVDGAAPSGAVSSLKSVPATS